MKTAVLLTCLLVAVVAANFGGIFEKAAARANVKEMVGKKIVKTNAVAPHEVGRTINIDELEGTVRVVRPGDMVTADFNPNRMTIYVDENDVIKNVRYA